MNFLLVLTLVTATSAFSIAARAAAFPGALVGHYSVEQNTECTLNGVPQDLDPCVVAENGLGSDPASLVILQFQLDGKDTYTFAERLPRTWDQIIFVEQNGVDSDGWKFSSKIDKLDDAGFAFTARYEDPPGNITRQDRYVLELVAEGWFYTQITSGKDKDGDYEIRRKFKVNKDSNPFWP